MPIAALRAAGAVLAAVGLLLGVVAATYAARLGGDGTATFRLASPDAPVVVGPSLLARVDAPVSVTATAERGAAWLGVASASDASAVVGAASHQRVTGVSLTAWTAQGATEGSGATVDAARLDRSDVWLLEKTGSRSVTVTLQPQEPPAAVVAAAQEGALRSVTVSWQHGRWAALAWGSLALALALLAGGAALLWRARPARTGEGR
ncbi:MAG TPA: hypothetical protein VES95_07250 [Dermatophilaceae bacterium]|nr:hypothetical protein [Dermatophilaceae bacterium]